MRFKELFDREFLTESHVRKGLKIFYEIDLKLIKSKEEMIQQTPVQQPIVQQPETPAQEVQAPEIPQQKTPQQVPQEPVQNQTEKPDLSGLLSSVQTEEEASEDNNIIMRHFNGEYDCKSEQADNIQTFEDLISILGDVKKNGVNILDDFSKEIIILCANQNYNEIKTKLDKKSKIFAEVYFGYKKDDSVGVRFKKSENSDSLSSSILINDQIVTLTKFDIEKVNQKIVEYRNYEASKA